MTITVEQRTLGGNPTAALTLVRSQAVAAPATWTRLTTLGAVVRGSFIRASSDAEPFRIAIVPPSESWNASGPMPEPRDNGVLISNFGAGAQVFETKVSPNTQVWVKRA